MKKGIKRNEGIISDYAVEIFAGRRSGRGMYKANENKGKRKETRECATICVCR
jgi:hypothetical protein